MLLFLVSFLLLGNPNWTLAGVTTGDGNSFGEFGNPFGEEVSSDCQNECQYGLGVTEMEVKRQQSECIARCNARKASGASSAPDPYAGPLKASEKVPDAPTGAVAASGSTAPTGSTAGSGPTSASGACSTAHSLAKNICGGSQFAQMVTGPLSQMQMAQASGDYNAACKAAASIARNSAIMNLATGSGCMYARQRCTSSCSVAVTGLAASADSAAMTANRTDCEEMMTQALGSFAQGVSSAQSMAQSKLCEQVTANLPGAGGFDCTKDEYKNLPVCDTTPFCSKVENKENPWCVNSKGICEQQQNAGTDFCKCIADAKSCPTPPPPPAWPPITPPTYATTGGSDGGNIGGSNGGLSGGAGNCEDDLDCGISTASGGSTSGLGVPTITGTGNPDRLLTGKPGSAPNSNSTPGGGGFGGGGGGSGGGSGYAPSASSGKAGGGSDLSTDIIGGAGGGSSDPILSSNEGGGGDGDRLRSGGNGDDKIPKIDLAALLAAGATKDVKRGLASDPTLLASGITAANGMSNFEKVTRKMNEKRPVLTP